MSTPEEKEAKIQKLWLEMDQKMVIFKVLIQPITEHLRGSQLKWWRDFQELCVEWKDAIEDCRRAQDHFMYDLNLSHMRQYVERGVHFSQLFSTDEDRENIVAVAEELNNLREQYEAMQWLEKNPLKPHQEIVSDVGAKLTRANPYLVNV